MRWFNRLLIYIIKETLKMFVYEKDGALHIAENAKAGVATEEVVVKFVEGNAVVTVNGKEVAPKEGA